MTVKALFVCCVIVWGIVAAVAALPPGSPVYALRFCGGAFGLVVLVVFMGAVIDFANYRRLMSPPERRDSRWTSTALEPDGVSK